MITIKCLSCGADNDIQAKTCAACGGPVFRNLKAAEPIATPPAPPAPAAKAPAKPRRLALKALGVVVLLLFVWFVRDAATPPLLAKVELRKSTVTITNGNDVVWRHAVIRLNGELDAPRYEVLSEWAPNEVREIPLNHFTRTISQGDFKPEFERATEVLITADGLRLGIYR